MPAKYRIIREIIPLPHGDEEIYYIRLVEYKDGVPYALATNVDGPVGVTLKDLLNDIMRFLRARKQKVLNKEELVEI